MTKNELEKVMDKEWLARLETFDTKPSKKLQTILKPVFTAGFTSGATAVVKGLGQEIVYGH